MHLNWYQRPDGYWNAECTCGSTLCGFDGPNVGPDPNETPEAWHFRIAREDSKRPTCGPVPLPEAT